MTEYPYFPPKCQNGTCGHEAGQCFRWRSRRCVSGECGHAAQGLACGVGQAPPAPAPITELPNPYGYRVERMDGHEWTFSTGYITRPDDAAPQSLDSAARDAAESTRIGHSYSGALRVSIWAHRGDQEHYRNPVPADAFVLDFAAATA